MLCFLVRFGGVLPTPGVAWWRGGDKPPALLKRNPAIVTLLSQGVGVLRVAMSISSGRRIPCSPELFVENAMTEKTKKKKGVVP